MELPDGPVKMIGRQTRVDHRPQDHIATCAGEAVKIGNLHSAETTAAFMKDCMKVVESILK